MSCDYCKNNSVYMFQNGERICRSCLRDLPSDLITAKTEISELRQENRKLRFIIDEGF